MAVDICQIKLQKTDFGVIIESGYTSDNGILNTNKGD